MSLSNTQNAMPSLPPTQALVMPSAVGTAISCSVSKLYSIWNDSFGRLICCSPQCAISDSNNRFGGTQHFLFFCRRRRMYQTILRLTCEFGIETVEGPIIATGVFAIYTAFFTTLAGWERRRWEGTVVSQMNNSRCPARIRSFRLQQLRSELQLDFWRPSPGNIRLVFHPVVLAQACQK